MSLRPQGPSTAPEKQGRQSRLLADALRYGPDAVQEAGDGQDIKQGFPASARVVRDLEEAEVERQLLLRDAAVRAQLRPSQRPEPLDRVGVDSVGAWIGLVA